MSQKFYKLNKITNEINFNFNFPLFHSFIWVEPSFGFDLAKNFVDFFLSLSCLLSRTLIGLKLYAQILITVIVCWDIVDISVALSLSIVNGDIQ